MAHEYMFVGLLMAGALLLALAALGLAWFVRPHKGHGAKTATYECGMEVIGGAWVQFRVDYSSMPCSLFSSTWRPPCSCLGRWPTAPCHCTHSSKQLCFC